MQAKNVVGGRVDAATAATAACVEQPNRAETAVVVWVLQMEPFSTLCLISHVQAYADCMESNCIEEDVNVPSVYGMSSSN